ncbi:MAG: hypothetical protein ACK5T6_13445 [Pirellula sp.]|jgi:hypothetical protein
MFPYIEPRVVFVASQLSKRWPELVAIPEQPVELCPSLGPRLFQNENIWVVTTYLRLKKLGANVAITDRLQPNAINVASERDLLKTDPDGRAFIVATQGDRGKLIWADHTLAQSPVMAKATRTSLIDMWPQPGLVGRDPRRGNQIRRLGYIGFGANLAPAFRSESFRQQLALLGIDWVVKEDPGQWHDYSDLDLCLAVRDLPWHWIRTKPSTKLVHAWLTGVPALLGPEPAYQHWGKPGTDYFEIRTPEDALNVVQRLQAEPQLYLDVQQRGFEKGRSHDEAAVCKQWENLLWGPISEQFSDWSQASHSVWGARKWRRKMHILAAPIVEKWFYLRARGWIKGISYGIGRRLKFSGRSR